MTQKIRFLCPNEHHTLLPKRGIQSNWWRCNNQIFYVNLHRKTQKYSHTKLKSMNQWLFWHLLSPKWPNSLEGIDLWWFSKMWIMAEGFYSHYHRSFHHTKLSDIDFESLLFSTVSKQYVWNFACRRGLLISLIARKFFEIGRR